MRPLGPLGGQILANACSVPAAASRFICIASSRQTIAIAHNGFVVWTCAGSSGMMSLLHDASCWKFPQHHQPRKLLARTPIEDATEAIQRLGLFSLRTRLFPHWDRGRTPVCLARLGPLGDLGHSGATTPANAEPRKAGGFTISISSSGNRPHDGPAERRACLLDSEDAPVISSSVLGSGVRRSACAL